MLAIWIATIFSVIIGSIGMNSRPLIVTKVAESDGLSFHGEKTVPFNFQTVKHLKSWYFGSDVLLLSGQEYVFMLNTSQTISNTEANYIGLIRWFSNKASYDSCRKKGKLENNCHNFIRVVERVQDDRLYVCGTNSYAPVCRYYTKKQFLLANKGSENNSLFDEEVPCNSQQCECPYNPYTSSAVLYSETTNKGPHIFASVNNAFLDDNDVLLRKPMTDSNDFITTDKSWMNNPSFIKIIEYSNKVYLFFVEKANAAETGSGSPALYARVAQVCKNDVKSNSRMLRNNWSSFVKTRLRCTLTDTSGSQLDFNNLTSVSEIIRMQLKPDTPVEDVVLTTFSTPVAWQSAQLSAVCAFSLQSIQSVFETGSFLKESDDGERSEPFPATDVPSPRLGTCTNTSLDGNAEALDFAKRNHLMYDSITTKHPLYISEPGVRMTQVTADMNAGNTGNTVVYVGTEDAQILRLRPFVFHEFTQLMLLEEKQLASYQQCENTDIECTVHALKILPQRNQKTQPLLFIAFTDRAVFIQLSTCNQYTSSECCNFDPNCAWSVDQCKDRYILEGNEAVNDVTSADDVPLSCSRTEEPATSSPTTDQAIPSGAGVGMFMIGFLVGVVFVLAILLAKQWNYCGISKLKSHSVPSSTDVKLSPVLLDVSNHTDGINHIDHQKEHEEEEEVTVSTPLKQTKIDENNSVVYCPESKALDEAGVLKVDEITLIDEESTDPSERNCVADDDGGGSIAAANNKEYARLQSAASEPG